MATRRRSAELAAAARRALHPPLRDRRFWLVQAMVALLAGLHLFADLHASAETGAFPGGLPVALLVVPVGYAALRYGLTGSAATGIWATLLWLPDLLLPIDRGHAPSDLVNLVLVDVVAFVFGQHIEAERLAHARVQEAISERLNVEAGYRQLFEANRAPTLVLDSSGGITGANPAARALFGDHVVGASASALIAVGGPLQGSSGQVVALGDGRDYRVGMVALPAGSAATHQLILDDVTEERNARRRATRYAALVVAAEEDQRRRLARELHDEPLQLFLHLARRLEQLEATTGAPGLGEARAQALQAAVRLRSLTRDLRPPALDQLGLVAAVSSLLAEVEEETGLHTDLEVSGHTTRLSPEVELGAFRIVQEALRNTVRHAEARHVWVVVTFEPGGVALLVADDGHGFIRQEGAELASGHLGLLGMAERASVLGGHLRVQSAPGSGTRISVVLSRTEPRSDAPSLSR